MYFPARKSLLAAAVSLSALLGLSAHANAATLAQGYNAFVFGDFLTQDSDVEGRLAVGGNMAVTGYSVGDKITNPGGNALVVGGDLTFSNGRVYYGDVVVGGNYTGPGYDLAYGYNVHANVSPLPVDFAAEKQTLLALSDQLANLTANGSVSKPWSTVELAGDLTDDYQVFDIDGSLLMSNYAGMRLDASTIHSDATVIVNVSGTDLNFMQGLDGFTALRQRVIFNFYEATSIEIGSIAVQGSILAPYATIDHNWGVIWGQVIVENYHSSVQVNNIAFNGKLPPPPDNRILLTPSPEPASAAFAAMGVLALAAGFRRRR